MKQIFTFCVGFCLLALCSQTSKAQNIIVTSAENQNVGTFITNNLLGDGIYIFNATFNDGQTTINQPQVGTFDPNGYLNLQMTAGVIMTTGNIDVAPGPNNSNGQSNAVSNPYVDPLMEPMATNTIRECATIDFDFVSMSSYVSFNYCFASEEYPEYVGSGFNDIFAFLLTGPDPTTMQERTWNIATIPGTVTEENPDGIAVAINSVNPGQPGSAGNASVGYYQFSQYYESNPSNATGIQYDGFTRKLAAEAVIMPCELYHMHISICNLGDMNYDSGVFLEANSFQSNISSIGLSRPGIDTIQRSCPLVLPLTLSQTSFDKAYVDITFGGNAVNGTDYIVTSDSGALINAQNHGMYITNGQNSLTVACKAGAYLAQPKTLDIYYEMSLCEIFPSLKVRDTMHMLLMENKPLQLRDTTIKANNVCLNVGVGVQTGNPTQFQWIPSTGIDHPDQQYSSAFIYRDSEYKVVGTDAQGCVNDTAKVKIIITHNGATGIDEATDANIKVYPNPIDNILNIEGEGIRNIEIWNTEGSMLYRGNETAISTDFLPAGVYIIRINTNNGTAIRKAVKK